MAFRVWLHREYRFFYHKNIKGPIIKTQFKTLPRKSRLFIINRNKHKNNSNLSIKKTGYIYKNKHNSKGAVYFFFIIVREQWRSSWRIYTKDFRNWTKLFWHNKWLIFPISICWFTSIVSEGLTFPWQLVIFSTHKCLRFYFLFRLIGWQK